MPRYMLTLPLFVSLGCYSIAAPSDVSGQWIIKQERDFRGNDVAPYECTFKQSGRGLTVKCGKDPKTIEYKGYVRDRSMTWRFETDWSDEDGTKDRIAISYTADIDESGTTAKGIWRLTSSVLDERGKFEAHKEQ
jgi:hypothetical protein